MEDWPDVKAWLETLRQSRPVFHSEADFQHALAWAIQMSDASARVRLETRPAPGQRLDMLISRPDLGRHLVLELKYLTASWTGDVGSERFELLNQGAQDIRAYDVVKDVQRVEQFVGGQPGWSGVVLVLTNDPGYWSRPAHGRITNADAFRIYEDQMISGDRGWGVATGVGTMKDRERAIHLHGEYRCRWSDYSVLPGRKGRFRVLVIPVDMTGDAVELPEEASGGGTRGQPPAVAVLHAKFASPSTLPASAGAPADSAAMIAQRTVMDSQRYSVDELRAELRRFERQLRAAGLKETSITTYTDRTNRFLKWLDGDYQPRGPN